MSRTFCLLSFVFRKYNCCSQITVYCKNNQLIYKSASGFLFLKKIIKQFLHDVLVSFLISFPRHRAHKLITLSSTWYIYHKGILVITACSLFVKTKAYTMYLKIFKKIINRIFFQLIVLIVCLEFLHPNREFFTQPLPVKGYTFCSILSTHVYWAVGFYNVPHLLWQGASVHMVISEDPWHCVLYNRVRNEK